MNLNELNILLADDDTDDCLFFKDAVTVFIPPANFTAVHDGEQLMQLLCNETCRLPDLIFLDLNMPRKNGFACLAEIKLHTKLKTIPVVIFSTSGEYDEINAVFKSGANVYIRKPRSFEQLVKVIHHALQMATENIIPIGKLKYVLNA
ncbi:MAG: response regulator [Ferruginibacter sp.]